MRTEAEVCRRTAEIREKLSCILEKTSAEMAKPYTQRDYRLLRFLNREQHVWMFALTQMEWLLTEE
jgi:hypothetical protein